MYPHGAARFGGGIVQLLGVIRCHHRLHNRVFRQLCRFLRWGVGQNQNGMGDPAAPQLQRLFHVGNAKKVRARRVQCLGDRHRAVSVRVRFHDRDGAAAGSQRAGDHGKIMSNRIQIHFGPGAFQKMRHDGTTSFSE